MRQLIFLVLISVTLAACGGGNSGSGRSPVAMTDGEYKVGSPYRVAGQRFVPREDWNYNETGIASWYGPNFHGRPTANGERFDQNLFTAAHTTLQLPVHARVTNLENGRSVIVRINDRGPFVSDRIIDLSRAAAEELDMIRAGTARVRVEVIGRAPLDVSSADAREVMSGEANARRYASNARREDRNVSRRSRRQEREAEENRSFAEVIPQTPVAIERPVMAASSAATYTATNTAPATVASAYPDTPVALEPPTSAPNAAPANRAMTQPHAAIPERNYAAADPQYAVRPPSTPVAIAAPAPGSIYVQTGAYLVEANALEVAEALDAGAMGQVASVDPAWINDRLFYRVRLGPFASPEEASAALRQVASRGHASARIVVE